MTTVQEFISIKLAVKYGLSFERAGQIVAEEVESWRVSGIPLMWGEDITKATRKVKSQAWFSAQEKYKEVNREHRKENV
jgi:hypothetical protein